MYRVTGTAGTEIYNDVPLLEMFLEPWVEPVAEPKFKVKQYVAWRTSSMDAAIPGRVVEICDTHNEEAYGFCYKVATFNYPNGLFVWECDLTPFS